MEPYEASAAELREAATLAADRAAMELSTVGENMTAAHHEVGQSRSKWRQAVQF